MGSAINVGGAREYRIIDARGEQQRHSADGDAEDVSQQVGERMAFDIESVVRGTDFQHAVWEALSSAFMAPAPRFPHETPNSRHAASRRDRAPGRPRFRPPQPVHVRHVARRS